MPRIESKPSGIERHPLKERSYRKSAVKEIDAALAAELGVERALFTIEQDRARFNVLDPDDLVGAEEVALVPELNVGLLIRRTDVGRHVSYTFTQVVTPGHIVDHARSPIGKQNPRPLATAVDQNV